MSLAVRYDVQVFDAQVRGGISRSFVELMREFDADPALGVEVVTGFREVRNQHLLDAFPARYSPAPQRGRIRARLQRAGGRAVEPAASVVHHTYYDPKALDAADGLPSISTVHDMIPELFPEYFPSGNPHLAKDAYVRASSGLICVSETTRRDVERFYGDVTADVVVIPHGVGEEFRSPAVASVDLPDRYVLFVGRRDGYKDWRVLVEACAGGALGDGVALVCLGGGPFTGDEQALLSLRGLRDRTQQLSVSDADLPGVYAAAALLAFPSRYEGFGLPVLEAFAAGCPVVLADIECFREVADDAGRYFPAGDVEALASAIATVLADGAARDRLVASGRLRAADFTWRRTAEATADFYRAVAS